MFCRTASFLLAASSLAALATANVLVVAPSGADHADIQAAIDAAANGDVILVRTGNYFTFSVPDKTLEIVADTGAHVVIVGAIRVRNLSAGKHVLFSRLDATGTFDDVAVHGYGFFATACAGSIRVQDCVLNGARDGSCPKFPGARIENCADVVLVRCPIEGSVAPIDTFGPEGARGLDIQASNVAIYDSTARGTDGQISGCGYGGFCCDGPGDWNDGSDGGTGALLVGGYLFAAGTSMAGGNGHDGMCVGLQYAFGGNGGGGLAAWGTGTSAELLGSGASGGAGGLGCCTWSCGTNGSPGPQYADGFGATITMLGGSPRPMSVASPVRELTNLHVQLYGQPGDAVSLVMSNGTAFTRNPAYVGVQVFAPAPLLRQLLVGTIGASGAMSTDIQLPDLGAGVLARTYWMQAILRDTSGVRRLSTPQGVVVLDSAY